MTTCPPGEGVGAPDPGGRGSDQRVNGAPACYQYCRSIEEQKLPSPGNCCNSRTGAAGWKEADRERKD